MTNLNILETDLLRMVKNDDDALYVNVFRLFYSKHEDIEITSQINDVLNMFGLMLYLSCPTV